MRTTNFTDEQQLTALVGGDYITKDDATRAQAFAKKNKTNAVDFLLSEDLITRDLIGQALAEQQKVAYLDLNSHKPTREALQSLPEDVATKYRLVVVAVNTATIQIATDELQKAQSAEKDIQKVYG